MPSRLDQMQMLFRQRIKEEQRMGIRGGGFDRSRPLPPLPQKKNTERPQTRTRTKTVPATQQSTVHEKESRNSPSGDSERPAAVQTRARTEIGKTVPDNQQSTVHEKEFQNSPSGDSERPAAVQTRARTEIGKTVPASQQSTVHEKDSRKSSSGDSERPVAVRSRTRTEIGKIVPASQQSTVHKKESGNSPSGDSKRPAVLRTRTRTEFGKPVPSSQQSVPDKEFRNSNSECPAVVRKPARTGATRPPDIRKPVPVKKRDAAATKSEVRKPSSQNNEIRKKNTERPEGRVPQEQCSVCGRNFARDRIEKHSAICRRAAKKRRKVFDATRVRGTEAENFLRNAAKPPAAKAVSWRARHEELVQAVRAARRVARHVAAGGRASDLPPPPPADTSHYVPCPHCGRRFNPEVAHRHIPKCNANKKRT